MGLVSMKHMIANRGIQSDLSTRTVLMLFSIDLTVFRRCLKLCMCQFSQLKFQHYSSNDRHKILIRWNLQIANRVDPYQTDPYPSIYPDKPYLKCKVVIIFLFINKNECFGCQKEPSL